MAFITEWMGVEDCLLLSGLPWIAFCPVIDPATLARAGARKQLGDQRKTSQPLLHRNMPYQTKPNQTIVYIAGFVPAGNAFVPLAHICGSFHCSNRWKSKVKMSMISLITMQIYDDNVYDNV